MSQRDTEVSLLIMPITSEVICKSEDLPALVLIHGLGSAGNIWKSLYAGLEDSFTIYPLDLPGHGNSPLGDEALDPRSLAQQINEAMSADHGVNEFHVAGNSLGGWIALELAAQFPDRVKSVTALAPAGLWHEGPTQKLPPTLTARMLAKISQHFLKLAYNLPPLKALGYRKITHLWRQLSFESCRDSVIAMARSIGYTPMWRALRFQKFDSEISESVSVAIIFGDDDLTLPHPRAQEREVAPDHSQWIVVENCAHVIMWNYPEMTVDFIKRTAFSGV
jgi:pimeloyl-ACP methyl ester carboxylesterase